MAHIGNVYGKSKVFRGCNDEDCWTKEKVDALENEDWALDDEE